MKRVVILALAALAAAALSFGYDKFGVALFTDWPPRFGRPFPDIALVDACGERFRIADMAGRAALVHAADMSSPAASAYAGGQTLGGFGGVRPQPGLRSLEFYLARHGAAAPGDPRVAIVHLLLYDEDGGAPDAEDAARWAAHFRLEGRPNVVVAAPARDLRGSASLAILPGVWLLDADGFVRYAAAGRNPRHDLLGELLPGAAALVAD